MILAELKTAPTGVFQFVGDGELNRQDGGLFVFDGEFLKFTGDGSKISLKDAPNIFSDFSQINRILP